MKSEEKLKSEIAKANNKISEYLDFVIKELQKESPDKELIASYKIKIDKMENKVEAVEWVLSDEPEPEENKFDCVTLQPSHEGCTAWFPEFGIIKKAPFPGRG